MVHQQILRRGLQRALWAVLAFICLWAGKATPTGGQVVLRGQEAGNFFLPAPRALRQHLNRARQAIQEERYGDAVLDLGALLTGDLPGGDSLGEPQDFFLVESGSGHAKTSLKSEAQRLLGSLPERGRELYELQYGADAQALLDDAVRSTDFDKLNEVVRRYFHTRAGYEATVLLGRLHLDRGEPLAAALCFRRVLAAKTGAARFDPELSVMLAACWMYADRPMLAAQTLERLQARYPRAVLRFGDGPPEPLPAGEDAMTWLTHHFGSGLPARVLGESQWLLHRGDLARNASADGGIPLSTLRWRAPIAMDPSDEELIREIQQGDVDQNIVSLSSLQPLAVNDVLLMRTAERLLAVDFATGKRVWEYPWWDSSYPTVATGRQGGPRTQEMEERRQQLAQRLWQDAPYGQLASDGNAVYLLEDLRFANPRDGEVQWIPRPRRGGGMRNPNWPQDHNQLVALDLHRQGALKWIVGGESGMNEPRLAGAYFLGPPLPLMGQLYVLAELHGEIRLLVLDAETGHQNWSQQLAHVDALTILRNQGRRLAGASPSFADGVLVCPTSAGTVVAVELATRALLWGYQYEPAMMEVNRFGLAFAAGQQPRGAHWRDATVTISDGLVLLTPVESTKMYCLDLLTGEPLWSLPRQGALPDAQFLAAVDKGRVILVGRHHVTAVRLTDGRPAWRASIELDESRGEMPSGTGFRAGSNYYLPTSTAEIVQIDLEEGRIAHRANTGQVLGNLICFGDNVISQGTDYLTTFYQIEPLRAAVAQRLEASPDDAWALARRGELLIHDGQLGEAIAVFRRAARQDPENEGVRSLLVTTLLSALREDFSTHRTLALELERLIERPRQRREYLRMMGSGLESAGQYGEALRVYLELADLVANEGSAGGLASLPHVQVDQQTSARLDRWLSARLAGLHRAADPELQQQLAEAVAQRWQQARGQSDQQVQLFLAFFAFHPLAVDALGERAERLASDDRALEAELLVREVAEVHSAAAAVAVAQRVAAGLSRQGKHELALQFYRLLAERWPQVATTDGRSSRRIWDEALRDPAISEAWQPPPSYPWGRVELSSSTRRTDNLYRRVIPIPVRSTSGQGDPHLTVSYDGTSAILVHDGHGESLGKVPLENGRRYLHLDYRVNYARLYGQLLITVLGDQVIGIDLSRSRRGDADAIRWQEPVSHSLTNTAGRQSDSGSWDRNNPLDRNNSTFFFVKDSSGQPIGGVGPVTSRGIFVTRSRSLVCLDPVTGKSLWSRENVGRAVDVFGDEQQLFIVPRSGTVASVFSTADGSVLGTRTVPDWEHRWTTRGRRILVWEAAAGGVRLDLYDAWTESVVWSELVPSGTRGDLVGDRAVALLEPGGRFLVRPLEDLPAEIDTRLAAEPNLTSIHVLVSRDDYTLVTNSPVAPDDDSVFVREMGTPAPLVHGRLYVFSRETGQPRWPAPAMIRNFGLPLFQPTDVPTLWFVRQISTRQTRRSNSISDRTSVLCLDKRTGRVLLSEGSILNRTPSYQVVGRPAEQMVQLYLPNHTLSVRFTEEPIPPEPPAQ